MPLYIGWKNNIKELLYKNQRNFRFKFIVLPPMDPDFTALGCVKHFLDKFIFIFIKVFRS